MFANKKAFYILSLYLIAASFLIIYACNYQSTVPSLTIKDKISNEVKIITTDIEAYKTVDEEFVGYAGSASEQYKRFLGLNKIATDKELALLTDHPNSSVRVYAFWGLAKRNFDMHPLIEKHLKDTGSFVFKSGCIGMGTHVNKFYINLLTKDYMDLAVRKLSNQEVFEYKKRIRNGL